MAGLADPNLPCPTAAPQNVAARQGQEEILDGVFERER
jgi:hypothetical protein